MQPTESISLTHMDMCSGLTTWDRITYQGSHPIFFKIYFYHKIHIMCDCMSMSQIGGHNQGPCFRIPWS